MRKRTTQRHLEESRLNMASRIDRTMKGAGVEREREEEKREGQERDQDGENQERQRKHMVKTARLYWKEKLEEGKRSPRSEEV